LAIARNYERGGASALSVLTEEKFFEGSIEYLARIRRITGLPLLRKDFIIDPYQIYETRVFGGDALLLIARILDAHTLARFIALAELLHMAPLVEVHTMKELKKALFAGATIIGINNRDLDTFVTDITVSASLAPFIPPWICIVSESGIWSRNEIDVLSEKGIHAFLIGESLMRSNDVVAALEGLTGKKK
ncbi:MAG: indole-3-glycerol phosphate synthase TrpC, partial [Syntrophales bacterium]|nr:indole-3-glycerol phosphate synthase TrpC [Syntrophales bacterium]